MNLLPPADHAEVEESGSVVIDLLHFLLALRT